MRATLARFRLLERLQPTIRLVGIDHLAEAKHRLGVAHRQDLLVAPHVGIAGLQSVPRERRRGLLQIVAGKQRLPTARAEIVELVGSAALTTEAAFEMREGGPCHVFCPDGWL